MRIVVAGAGNVGSYLAAELHQRGHDVTLIEKRAEPLERITDGVRTLKGDACAPAVLERAELRSVDVVAAVTGDDEDNLAISLLAKEEFAVPRVLARVNYPSNEWLFTAAWGVDLAVSPPHLLTALVEEEVLSGDLISLLKLQRGDMELIEVRLDHDSVAAGRRVDSLDMPQNGAVVAIMRGQRVMPARGTTPLAEGDEILALVAADEIEQLRQALLG